MSIITIDKEKCTGCGHCTKACPYKLIQINADNNLPQTAPHAEKACMDCGHCVAVCPHGALTHKSMSPDECMPLNPEWHIDEKKAEYFLRSRRSIRNFKQKKVEKETLHNLIRTASYAPSGHNSQPVNWLVIHDTEKLRELTAMVIDWMKDLKEKNPSMAKMMNLDMIIAGHNLGFDAVCWSAPHLIAVHGHKKNPLAPDSCRIAMAYLDLAANSFHLGTCWAGFFYMALLSWQPLKEALGMPEDHNCYGTMITGYPELSYKRFPVRKEPQIKWS